MKANKFDLRVTGLGGQGVILSSYILGKAAAIFGNLNATMTQSFGPEARGSACSAQLVVDKNRVLDPYLKKQDILIAMSQEGYEKFAGDMNPNGTLVYEKDLVTPKPDPKNKIKAFGVPATRLAQDVVGKTLTINIVMLGFFAAVTKLIPRDALEEAVKSSVPSGTENMNMLAFKTGYEYYEKPKGK